MNEWLKKMGDWISNFWKNSSVVKKVILFGVIAIVIVAIVVTARVSSKPTGVRLFNSQVSDQAALTRILDRISQENIEASASADGYIIVEDERTARKLRAILVSENILPSSINPYADFYNRSWNTTDLEQQEKLKQATANSLKNNIESFDDVIHATVSLSIPEQNLFSDTQLPVKAGIILTLAPNSDLKTNRSKVLGIQRIIKAHVPGLLDENIDITDTEGNVLNDFESMAESDRISLIEKQQKLRRKLEAEKKAELLKSLQKLASEDRIRDLNISIEMDMSEKRVESTKYSPIEIKPDNPDTPYDDSEYRDTLPISEQTVTKEWQGTGFNPEGPAGVEGQTPPVYSDMSNVIGKSTETGVTRNNVINTEHTIENVSPQTGRVTVSFNVDGRWRLRRDPKTHKYIVDEETGGLVRDFTPVSDSELAEYRSIAEHAVGANRIRGDSVYVGRIEIDRNDEFEEFDAAYFKKQQTQRTILLVLAAIAIVLVGFVLFRFISKEMERRRRLREEELLRQQQAEREKALWEARDDANMQVTMSVEESRRAELQEAANSLAREHPEDVAMLIRTWLMEE
ncbi:MAG: flagellar M-ring protein FliF [Treponema sp.]|nr:flagellar M-ring protein FliF [Treponema sp.]MBD5411687.1 flagellar M-ring protein FliF [Treponema sp.]MBD5413292.1 flagellar M-ring protein FliF [Treponema sp.]MBD5442574.1 flagellar M-ring protein FliF [Treponema sp.]